MNVDSIFRIGSDHKICEDYALSGVNKEINLAYAIVCDGCSASEDVDIGSRILALSAKEYIPFIISYEKVWEPDSTEMGKGIIRLAKSVFQKLPSINPCVLDCTLLMAWVQNKFLTAYLYGDGVFIHRNKDKVKSIHINLTSGAPDYLSYYLDKNRMDAYEGILLNKKEIIYRQDDQCPRITKDPFTPEVIKCAVEEGDIISVISDGINSFKKLDSTLIPWSELVDEFTKYKNFEGEFVSRRISAFLRNCSKNGIIHYDDISIASIIV